MQCDLLVDVAPGVAAPTTLQKASNQITQSSSSCIQLLGINNPRLLTTKGPLSIVDKSQLEIAVSSRLPHLIVSTLWKIPELRLLCVRYLLNDLDSQCNKISSNAFLKVCNKDIQSLAQFDWRFMILELASIAPDVIDFIISISVPVERERLNKVKCGDRRMPALGMALAIILHERSSTCSAVQRLLSLLMVDGTCSKRTFERFNHLGLCLSPAGTRKMLEGLASFQNSEITRQIRAGKSFWVVGDNFDLLIKV